VSRIILHAYTNEERDQLLNEEMDAGKLPPYTRQIIDRAGGWKFIGARSTEYNLQFIQDFIKDNWSSYQLDTLITAPPQSPALLEEGTQMVKALLEK
jgi:hypothetical protein